MSVNCYNCSFKETIKNLGDLELSAVKTVCSRCQVKNKSKSLLNCYDFNYADLFVTRIVTTFVLFNNLNVVAEILHLPNRLVNEVMVFKVYSDMRDIEKVSGILGLPVNEVNKIVNKVFS